VSANLLALLALGLAVVGLVFHFTEDDGDGGLTGAAGQPTATVGQPTPVVQPTPTPPTPTPPTVVEVSTDDDPFIGPEDAAVTIVEFSDYQ